MRPRLRSSLFALLLLASPIASAFAEPVPAPVWRLPDGSLTTPPTAASAGVDAAMVNPGADGTPAFRVPFAVAAGEVVEISLTAAAVSTAADAGAEGQAGVVLTLLPAGTKDLNNNTAEHRQIVIVGTGAELIRFAFRARADHAAGELLLVPSLAYFRRPLELSGLTFTARGAEVDPGALAASGSSYRGQEPDAAWRAEAAARIARHRQADLRVLATDRLGRPLPDLTVSVEQLRHAYPFGTAVVASRIADAPRVFTAESGMTTAQWLADNARYRREIERNFNTVVIENDLKWPPWDGSAERPEFYHQDWTLAALDWLHDRRFTVKGHTLVWGSWRFTPPWLREHEAAPDLVQAAVLAHIRDIGHATADRTHYWDVLNEPMSHRNLIELLGPAKVAEWFQTARAALPGVRLVMNEFDLVGNGGNARRRTEFLAFLDELRSHGAEIDVLGLQGHFWSERFTAPEDIWRIIDDLHEASDLPLMISEFDMNLPNEQLQADYTRDFLTAWFAHPATEAFIMWGFWGGAHWMGDAGAMYRRDWSEKPNLAAYRDLVYGDWWTRATLATDATGTATVRAFHGRHRVTLTTADGRTITREIDLPAEGRELQIVVPPPPRAPASDPS